MMQRARLLGLAYCVAIICLPANTIAADASCAPVLKAVRAGMAQARIHSAVDSPLDPEAVKMGMKQTLMHSIVIDKTQYSNALNTDFSNVPLDSPDMRTLATDLAAFEVESGCKILGKETIAGRGAQTYALITDLGRGEARIKLWVDAISGLPIKAIADEPDFDVETLLEKPKGKQGTKVNVTEKSNGKRVVSTHAYVYGDLVKPPGAKGTINANTLAALLALLK